MLGRHHREGPVIALSPEDERTFNPVGIPAQARVLDVGCGNGQFLIANSQGRQSVGVDIDFTAAA
jgi:SAM-dependent methyltransferase